MSLQEKTTTRLIEVFSNDYVSLHEFTDSDVMLCVAKAEYIPIEYFKNSFENIADFVKNSSCEALIFDKRNLNTFHQPSMEWYYTEWKAEMLKHGLDNHYKILPPMRWFAKSVEAGKKEIKRNHPTFDFDMFSVIYVDSIDEALAHFNRD